MTVLDLFAGPGGWDEGVAPLGIRPLGLELDATACATGRAAGHRREQQDVAAADPRWYGPVSGLLASPPCQGFSMAGKGHGRADAVHMLRELETVTGPRSLRRAVLELRGSMADPRSLLALEPLRWMLTLHPDWTAWEQVPTVLPLWQACAGVLQRHGWSVVCGVLNSEQYGVPQTRRRAVLVARAPWAVAHAGPVALPVPTHSRYYPADPDRLDPGVARWVSMAEALGWADAGPGDLTVRTSMGTPKVDGRNGTHLLDPVTRPAHTVTTKAAEWAIRSNYGTGGDPAARGIRTADQPAAAVTGKAGRNRWVAYRRTAGGYVRVDENAPSRTIKPGNPRGASAGPRFDDVIRLPTDMERLTTAEARELLGTSERHARVTVQEAAVLQSFPADYPWQGTSTARYRQVGDAVPPLLALHVVAAATGLALPSMDEAVA